MSARCYKQQQAMGQYTKKLTTLIPHIRARVLDQVARYQNTNLIETRTLNRSTSWINECEVDMGSVTTISEPEITERSSGTWWKTMGRAEDVERGTESKVSISRRNTLQTKIIQMV